jgi:hypothetical protein
MARLSTETFGRRIAATIDNGAKITEALDLPQVRDILATMDAHAAARFFLLFPFQVFKTLAGQIHLLRNHAVNPGPVGWYARTEKFAKDFADAKLNPLADSMPLMRALSAPASDRTKNAKLSRRLAGPASHGIFSANTEPDRHGKTFRDVYRDETHLYEAGWLPQISNRRGAYGENFKEVDMTTGLIAGTDAANLWFSGDQRTWHWRCPSCNKLHEPRFSIEDPATGKRIGGLIYTRKMREDGLPDEGAIAESLRYVCPNCSAEFKDSAASRAAHSGTADKPRGIYIAKNATPSERTFGWTCHGIAIRRWLPMVIRFEQSQIIRQRGDLEPLSKCIMEEFAGIWDPEKYFRPEGQNRYQHPTPYLMEEEWAGEIKDPQGRPMRFCTVDVQLDRYYMVIRKWGRWSQSRLHFTAVCFSAEEIAIHCARCQVPPERIFFDARHDAERVRRTCARAGWKTLMGDREMRNYSHEDGIRRIYAKPQAIDSMTGTELQAASGSYVVETLFSKNAALDRLHLLRSDDSRAPDGSPLWTAATNAPDWYFKQINAHFKKEGVWEGQKDDHAGDGEAMGVVTATMAELTGAETLGVATAG